MKKFCGTIFKCNFYIVLFPDKSRSFDSFIACSGGFPDCEEYFINLTNHFLKAKQTKTRNIYLTHGLKDFLDTEGVIKRQLLAFTGKIESKENIVCNLKIYENEGHVPFQSLYHALRFIYETEK